MGTVTTITPIVYETIVRSSTKLRHGPRLSVETVEKGVSEFKNILTKRITQHKKQQHQHQNKNRRRIIGLEEQTEMSIGPNPEE